MDEAVISQNRTGRIASGVAFTITIDVNTSTYNLIVNYVEKSTGISVYDTKTEIKKDGTKGSVVCPGKEGYVAERSSIAYDVKGSDVTVTCYYTKEIINDDPVEESVQN